MVFTFSPVIFILYIMYSGSTTVSRDFFIHYSLFIYLLWYVHASGCEGCILMASVAVSLS